MSIGTIMDEGTATKRGRKSSLQDLRWLETGLVQPGHPSFSPDGPVGSKDNNIKDDLQVEWGYGTIPPDLSDPSAGMVDRNIPQEFDAAPVIFFARDQMNRGLMGRRLHAAMRAKFGSDAVTLAGPALARQLAWQGIVGTIAVDGRGYKSCREALASASASPYKSFIRHVVGCQCGTPHMVPDGRSVSASIPESTGNPMDDFMAAGPAAPPSMVAHCQSTMLPVLVARGDLDDSELDQTLTEMVDVTGLPRAVAARIRGHKGSNLQKVRVAFRFMEEARESAASAKYTGKVNTSEFIIDTEDRPVELVEPVDASQMDVDPAPFEGPVFEGASDIDLDDVRVPAPELDVDMRGEMEV